MEEKKLAVIALGKCHTERQSERYCRRTEPKYPGDFGESDLSGS